MTLGANPHEYETVFDYTGRTDKDRCEHPRRWSQRATNVLETRVIYSRCGKCQPCLNNKRARRTARAMAEVEAALRTWFDTRTSSQQNYLRFLADRDNPAALSILEHGFPSPEAETTWNLNTQKHIVTNYIKRIRKPGHKIRVSKHWEKHADGRDHCHLLIHETTTPVMRRQLEIAAFIMPRGYQLPERHPRDNDDKYFARVLRQLWEGWREWMRLRDDPSDEARERRRQLPFQTGMTGSPQDRTTGKRRAVTSLIRDNTRKRLRDGSKAVYYAAKAARYSAKSGGRWSASPGYGKPFQGFRMNTRENRNLAMAAMAALWLTVANLAHAAGPGSHDPHKGAASCPSGQDGIHSPAGWCRLAALSQELGPNGPRKHPLAPPTTGPPKQTPALPQDTQRPAQTTHTVFPPTIEDTLYRTTKHVQHTQETHSTCASTHSSASHTGCTTTSSAQHTCSPTPMRSHETNSSNLRSDNGSETRQCCSPPARH